MRRLLKNIGITIMMVIGLVSTAYTQTQREKSSTQQNQKSQKSQVIRNEIKVSQDTSLKIIEQNLVKVMVEPDTIYKEMVGFSVPIYLDTAMYENAKNDSLLSNAFLRARKILKIYLTRTLSEIYPQRKFVFKENPQDSIMVGNDTLELFDVTFNTKDYSIPVSMFYRVFEPTFETPENKGRKEEEDYYLLEVGYVVTFETIRVYPTFLRD